MLLQGYEAVVNQGSSKYAERAAFAAARIYYFELQDYAKSKIYFTKLKELATTPENQLEALRGFGKKLLPDKRLYRSQ